MFKIVKINEVNSKDLFKLKDFLLGDKDGKFFIIDKNGTPYGRYNNINDAYLHLSDLND